MADIYIYRRLGGKKRQLTPIGKSVSVSFRVRVVRACVRSCVSVCGGMLLNAGGSNGEKSGSGLGCIFSAFAAIRIGFKQFPQYLQLYAWVLRIII